MVDTEPRNVSHSATSMPSDVDMGRAIVKGCAVGIPLMFAILFAIELIGGMDVEVALIGALLPAGIFGAFIGSAFFIGRASDAAEHH